MHSCTMESEGMYCFFVIVLDKITEWKRLDRSDFTIISGSLEEVSILWKLGSSLKIHLDSSLCGFSLGSFVVLLSLQDFLLALGWSDVLNANMNTLFDNSSIDQLVDTYTDGRLRNIEDDSSSSVVSLVGHTLVDRGIGENINIVTNLDLHQVLGKMNGTMLAKFLREHVSRTRSDTKRVRHVDLFL